MLNTTALTELYRRVMALAQKPQQNHQLVYLIGQTVSNQSCLLDKGATLDTQIAVPGHEGLENVCDYTGAKAWILELIERGVSMWDIIALPSTLVQIGDKMSFNAFIEQQDLVKYAKKKGLTDVAFVAPYWQVIRSFMGSVTACKRYYPELRVYPMVANRLPWDEQSVHSQGKLGGTRVDFMFYETIRLFEYHEKGDLPSAEDALEYLSRLE